MALFQPGEFYLSRNLQNETHEEKKGVNQKCLGTKRKLDWNGLCFLKICRMCLPKSGWWFGKCYMFPFSWECHPPNWRSPSFFRGVGWNHQPVIIGDTYMYILSIVIMICIYMILWWYYVQIYSKHWLCVDFLWFSNFFSRTSGDCRVEVSGYGMNAIHGRGEHHTWG